MLTYSSQAVLILDLCCNFVSLDGDSGQFLFIHASARVYLQLRPEYSTSMNNLTVAKRCLYLSMFDDEGILSR